MPKADQAKEQNWRAVIADSDASTLSRAEYCRQHKINLIQFKNWILRLREREDRPQKTETAKQRQVARADRRKIASKNPRIMPEVTCDVSRDVKASDTHHAADFAEVRLIQGREEPVVAKQENSSSLEVVFSGGTKLRIASDCPVELLFSVITLLEGS